MSTTAEITEQVKAASQWIKPLQEEIGRVLVGQKYLVDGLLTGLLTNGHILLEGVPGLAKTLAVKTLASCIHTGFQRIQFTPDLLPADLIGTLIYNPRSGEFTTKMGPLFSNLILADEINRAPAKVQSALLEAMQERQVTIGDTTYPLADPFLVLATQNPLEQEGTYQLPEAQLDRFMLKLRVGYPSKAEERKILDLMATSAPNLKVLTVTEPADIIRSREIVNAIYVDDRVKDYIVDVVFATRDPASYKLKLDGMIRYGASPRATIALTLAARARALVNTIYVDDRVKDYIVDVVFATRDPRAYKLSLDGMIRYGASPRATIALTLAARARAFMAGRGYVTPQDVKSVGPDVLRHRIIVSYEAEAEEMTSEQIIEKIFAGLAVP